MFLLLRLSALLLATGLLCHCGTLPDRTAARYGVPEKPGDSARWTRVTTRLANAIPRHSSRPWRFCLRPGDGVNARSTAGGRLEVTAGTLHFVRNDAELAAVLTHEMAHVLDHHARHRRLASWAVLGGSAVLGAVFANQGVDSATAAGLATGAFLTVSLTGLTRHHRAQELAADRAGLDLLRKAGYPLQAALTFWERYAALRASQGLGREHWWKSHPGDRRRIDHLRSLLTP